MPVLPSVSLSPCAAIPLGAGVMVLLGPDLAAPAAAALLLVILARPRPPAALVLMLPAALLTGAALVSADAGTLRLEGRVDAVVELRVEDAAPLLGPRRLSGRLRAVEAADPAVAAALQRVRRVRVALYAPIDVRPGETWSMCLRLRAPKGFANPGGGDFERRLFRDRVGALGYLRDPDCARRVRQAEGLVPDVRRHLLTVLGDRVPTRGGRLLTAMLLGDRSGFTSADWDLLAVTGTAHLVVVSGLHVGLVAGAVLVLGRLSLLAGGEGGALPALAGLVAGVYALLTGFGLPAQRALVMLLIGAWLLTRQRARSPLRALGWAASAVLLLDPLALLAPGFWLSFVAVLALILSWRGNGAPALMLVRAQLAITVALAPLLMSLQGGIAWVAPLVNLLLVPLVALLVMPLGLLCLLLAPLAPDWAAAGWWPLAWMLETLLGWLESAQPRLWPVRLAHPALIVPALLGALMLLLPLGVPLRGAAALLLVALLRPAGSSPPEGEARIEVLDVGQGLAVVVRTRSHALLYDAGPRFGRDGDAGSLVVVPALRALGVQRLDLLLVSHADVDHAGGAGSVRARVPVGSHLGAGGSPCRRGMSWRWDGVAFRILHPDPDLPDPLGDNAGSCVLLVETRHGAALLPGDVDRRVERRLLPDLPRLDLLVAPHHGSRTSSGAALLRRTRPSVVAFSAGVPGRFGHPHADVLARYLALDARIGITGRDGALTWDSRRPDQLLTRRAAQTGYWRWRAQ